MKAITFKTTSAKWDDMLARHAKLNLFADASNMVAPGVTWGKVKDDCAKLELKDKLEYVNKLWNRKRYVSDKMNFKKGDYWQTPYQFSRLGGDCEDFAIAKLLTLQELGIEGRMLVVRRNGKEHAVCVAEGWVLDNELAPEAEYECKLLASYDSGGAHVHMQGTSVA